MGRLENGGWVDMSGPGNGVGRGGDVWVSWSPPDGFSGAIGLEFSPARIARRVRWSGLEVREVQLGLTGDEEQVEGGLVKVELTEFQLRVGLPIGEMEKEGLVGVRLAREVDGALRSAMIEASGRRLSMMGWGAEVAATLGVVESLWWTAVLGGSVESLVAGLILSRVGLYAMAHVAMITYPNWQRGKYVDYWRNRFEEEGWIAWLGLVLPVETVRRVVVPAMWRAPMIRSKPVDEKPVDSS